MLAITNIVGSQATRDAHGVLYTRAGLEIGVAATKTFLAEVAAVPDRPEADRASAGPCRAARSSA